MLTAYPVCGIFITQNVINMHMKNIEDKRKNLFQIAASQQGHFTAKQALVCGYSHRTQYYHKEKGHWAEIDRGVFRLTNYPVSPDEDLVRWSLWSRNREDVPQAVISHETALSVHELGDVMPAKTHLTVPPAFRKKPSGGCVLHKKILSPEDIEKRDGFMVTIPLRTIVDVAEEGMSNEYIEQALRDAFSKGILVSAHIIETQMTLKAKEKLRIILEQIKKNPML